MSIKDDEPAGPDSFGGSDEDSHYMSSKQGLSDQCAHKAQDESNPGLTPYDRIVGRFLRYQVSSEDTKRIIEKLGITDEDVQELRTNLRARYPHLVKLLEEADDE
jgi:hypothetical protein